MQENTHVSRIQNKEMYSKVWGIEVKETDSNDLIVKGYIATTHLDSGWKNEDGYLVRDRIAKETLDKWASDINSGNPRSNKISINHNRESHVAGVGMKGTAKVDQLPDGEYGLYVESLIDKTKENFSDTEYRINKELLDSHSIEYDTGLAAIGRYYENAAVETYSGDYIQRTLLPGTILEGYTLASQPMNEHAIMIKEVLRGSNIKEQKEEVKMTEEVKIEDAPVEEVITEQPKEEEKEVTEKVEVKEEAEVVEEDKVEEPAKAELTEEEKELIAIGKETKEREAEIKRKSELKETIRKEIKEEVNKMEVKEKVQNTETEVKETREVLEYKEIFSKDINVKEQFNRACKLVNASKLYEKSKGIFEKEYKNFSTNGNKLEFKSLGITTNQNTDTDYLLSAAELSDVFDPIIYNALNQNTTTWGLLSKDDFSNKGNNQVQFTLKITANATAGAYTDNAVTTGNVGRLKYQTKFKKYQVGIEIDGDMIAAAMGGPIGDVFGREVADSTDDLMKVMNDALFAEVGLETAAGIIGFEYITDSAGNDTLYNLTRSTSNYLSPDSATDTYINGASADIAIKNLRAAKRQALTEGALLSNLVFVTSFIQGDKLRGIYDAAQRLVPTSSRFGFEGRPEFDGIPVFEDISCNDDDWFLIDLETHRIAIWKAPTLEMLGKDGDSVKGFVKTYFCTYNRAPRRMVQIYGNKTS